MEIRLSEHFDYKKLIRFTLPTIGMMIISSIYGIIDGLFISNIVGSSSFASINLILPFVMVLGTLGFMIGIGGAALVSKTLGEGKNEQANEYFSMLIYFLILAGIFFAVIGLLFIRRIAVFLGATEAMLDDCVTYGSVLLVSLPAVMLQYAFQSYLVVAERPRMGFIVSLISGAANVFMDFLFVYVLRLGILGAAVASAAAQYIGALIPLIFFAWKNNTCLRLVRTGIKIRVLLRSCGNGASEMVADLSMSFVSILYNFQLMRLIGSDGVVAYGINMYVSSIFFGVFLGYSTGSSPIVSYHYGAGNTEEMKNLLRRSMILTVIVGAAMTVVPEVFAGSLARIFVSYDAELLSLTKRAIRLFSLSYIMVGVNIYASGFFTALNNGKVSALISFLETFVFIAAAVLLLPIWLGLDGIWIAVVAAESAALLVSVICLRVKRKVYHY